MRFRLAVLSVAFALVLPAQPRTQLADHIVWDRSFPEMSNSAVSSAVVDTQGVLWLSIAGRIVRIDASGKFLGTTELLDNALPGGPEGYESDEMLAATPDGTVGLLITYFTAANDRALAARFTRLNRDGSAAGFTQVAGPDRWTFAFAGMRDNQFLMLAKSKRLSAIRFGAAGNAVWEHELASKPDAVAAVSLDGGASCIAQSTDGARGVMLKLDASGAELNRATALMGSSIALAPNPDGGCTLLHYARPKSGEVQQCLLTAFDSKLQRQWSSPVPFRSPAGGPQIGLARVKDGYVVIGRAQRPTGHGFFLAQYDFNGKLLWTNFDGARSWARFVLPLQDGYYLVGAPDVMRDTGLHVIRAK